MALTEKDVARLTVLARIALPDDEQSPVLAELNGLLPLIERLRSVDTTGVQPLAHPISAHTDVTLRLREDVVTETGTPEERARLQAGAPALAEGLFLVPKVLE